MPSGCSGAEWTRPDGQAHSAREYPGGLYLPYAKSIKLRNLLCLGVVTWIWGWWNQPSSCHISGQVPSNCKVVSSCQHLLAERPRYPFVRYTSGSSIAPCGRLNPPPPLLLRSGIRPLVGRYISYVANRQMPSGCSRAEWTRPDGQAHSAREYPGGLYLPYAKSIKLRNLLCLGVVTWSFIWGCKLRSLYPLPRPRYEMQ